ncbi:MAG: four helix bundle protein [Planctomycetota bacterium]|nr:four helix bundle protein [Planctomycetota bacterium]MDI6788250.1 four helix bundle protein [Planctomycetota bacterium]
MQNHGSNPKSDLKKRAYHYALDLIRFLRDCPNDIISQELKRQLLRSGTSIGANIIEAQASSSKKDFTNFFSYSLKSANESKFWLCLIRDATDVPKDKVDKLLQETIELSNILGASILTLKGKR